MGQLCKEYKLFRVINIHAREVRLALEKKINAIRGEYFLDGVDEFLDLLDICRYVCVGDYYRAWNHKKATPRMRAKLLNAIFDTCDMHSYDIIENIHQLYPDDKILNYFMGLIHFFGKEYDQAIKCFLKARNCEFLDERVFLHHLLLSSIFIDNKKLAGYCALRLAKHTDSVEVCMVLINYFIYVGKKGTAKKILRKIEKYLGEELIDEINEMINTGKYGHFYIYYPSIYYIQPPACPIRFLIKAIVEDSPE